MASHDLKILPEYFQAVKDRIKTFEIRKNDRNFQVGDQLFLLEYIPGKRLTGDYVEAKVVYITDYEQKDNYVVLGIELYKENE